MFKRIIEHIKHIESGITQLSARAAFAFALSCTERQWPVFQRALAVQSGPMEGQGVFRKAIDLAWDSLFQGIPISNDLLVACRREISSEAGDAPSAVVNTISNSVVDLISAIQRNDGTYSHHLSGRNLGLIELLLDEQGLLLDDLTVDSSEVKRIRPLVEEEIVRQDRDLQRLRMDDSDSMLETVRTESSGISLFNEVWFS